MKRKTITKKTAPAGPPLYQLQITLIDSDPPIWRRLVVPGDTDLYDLHVAMQMAFAWQNCHLHQFVTVAGRDRVYYGMTDPDFSFASDGMLDEREYTLAQIAPRAKKRFIYEYDFGDGWQHEILVEKILPPDPACTNPVCLDGANAAPPEDCGGIFGYYNLLEVLADPEHDEHDEMKEWLGDDFDPKAFDRKEVNAALETLQR